MNSGCLKVTASIADSPIVVSSGEKSGRLNIKCGLVCTIVEPMRILFCANSALISNDKILYQEQTRYVLQDN